MTAYYGSEVVPDAQGRFVIPPILREAAQLTGEVAILGQMDHLAIWNRGTASNAACRPSRSPPTISPPSRTWGSDRCAPPPNPPSCPRHAGGSAGPPPGAGRRPDAGPDPGAGGPRPGHPGPRRPPRPAPGRGPGPPGPGAGPGQRLGAEPALTILAGTYEDIWEDPRFRAWMERHAPEGLDASAHGPGRLQPAAEGSGPGLQFPGGGPPGHAHGPGIRDHRPGLAGRPDRDLPGRRHLRLRRGAGLPTHRPGHPALPGRRHPAHHPGPGGGRVFRAAPGSRPAQAADRPGHPHLPGHPHRRQRGTVPPGRGHHRRRRGPEARRPAGGGLLPQPGGPYRQADPAPARRPLRRARAHRPRAAAPPIRLVHPGGIKAGEAEAAANPPSRSARLRGAERLP